MKSVLVIEDNALVRELILSCLSKLPVKLRAVTSAEDAVASMRSEGLPDLVLSDVMLPERQGTDLVQHLRAHPATASLPVIAVTTVGEEDGGAHLRKLGFTDVIPKPIDPVNFATQVSRWLK
jgi:CheY-like chemotaxis protein